MKVDFRHTEVTAVEYLQGPVLQRMQSGRLGPETGPCQESSWEGHPWKASSDRRQAVGAEVRGPDSEFHFHLVAN